MMSPWNRFLYRYRYLVIVAACLLVAGLAFVLRYQQLTAFATRGVEMAHQIDATLVPKKCRRMRTYYVYSLTDLSIHVTAACDGDGLEGFQDFHWSMKPHTDI